ncbi:MAG: ATP-binding cassette domain-containing protein [Lachnospiraceae bacterium]|nr:ATP-binding cassette domain-containing protein [Lachnospiraceae bacterium]
MGEKNEYLIEVSHLIKRFKVKDTKQKTKEHQYLMAVNDVSFKIKEGEIVSFVGESGCGKSTLGRCILQLIKPSDGSVKYKGEELITATPKRLKELRKEMQIIFQNPYSSMNPRIRIGKALTEVLKEFHLYPGKERERILEVLDLVGMNEGALDKFPHQFSGGQLQRLAIARALLVEPKFIVADEPVSALDVSVQAQVVNLLMDLRDKLNLTIIFIAHDLSVVEHISDRVMVMYVGKIVEASDVDELYSNPVHPYTKALLSAIPIPDPKKPLAENTLEGETPSPINMPPGCVFKTRCPEKMEECEFMTKDLNYLTKEHFCLCYRAKYGQE